MRSPKRYLETGKNAKPARLYVVSTVLRWIQFDEKSFLLRVELVTGEIFSYPHVPKAVFEALLASKSKGQFFNAKIRDYYQFVHIT